MFERRAAGAGYAALANLLGATTGRVHSRQHVAAILRNRIYATGRLEYADVVSEHAAEAIVDEPLWHAVQAVSPGPRAPRSKAPWLLTGLLRCDACGHSLAPVKGTGRRRRDPRRGKMEWVPTKVTRSYRCPNRACSERAHVQAGLLERWVIRRSFQVEHELERVAKAPDLSSLEAELARAENRLEQALAPDAQDALGAAWASTVKSRRTERDDLARQLGEARLEAGVAARTFNLRELVEARDAAGLREALALLWKAIRVGRKGLGGTPLTFVSRGSGMADLRIELNDDSKEVAA